MDQRDIEKLSVAELQQLLFQKRYGERRERLRRLKDAGRVIDVAGLPPPNPQPPALVPPHPMPTGALQQYSQHSLEAEREQFQPARRFHGRWVLNKTLVLIELLAFGAFLFFVFSFLVTRQELNQELAHLQSSQTETLVLPTLTPTPIIGVVVLPGGHKPPVDGRAPEPGEAGYVPEHLLPIINAYVPLPIPTPAPEQARRIQIPAIEVDKPVVQGDDWEQLKKGVGQYLGSALPGQVGNLVLSAHNDVYGEIFRHLDKLQRGDEIIVWTERQTYTYVVRKIEVVEPTAVEVMAATEYASITLISCYPYLVNKQRIVVFGDLVEDGG